MLAQWLWQKAELSARCGWYSECNSSNKNLQSLFQCAYLFLILGSELSAEERFLMQCAELNTWQARTGQQGQILLTLLLPWVQMLWPGVNWKLWHLHCIYTKLGLVDLHPWCQNLFSYSSNPFCWFCCVSWRFYVWGYDDCVVRSASWAPYIDMHLENEICCCKLRGMQVGCALSKQGERLCPNLFQDTRPRRDYLQPLVFFLHFLFSNKSG